MGKVGAKIDHSRRVQYPVICTAEQENRLVKTLLVAATIAILSLSQSQAEAAIIELTTGDPRISPHVSGWKSTTGRSWSPFASVFSFGQHPTRSDPYYDRSYFIFDLSGVHGSIVSAELLMENGLVTSTDPFETVSLYDVSTPISVLLNQTAISTEATFNDLGTGVKYATNASFSSAKTDANVIRTFTLNQDALAAINAKIGSVFAMGGSMESMDPRRGVAETIAGSYSKLRLTVVPEPAAAMLAIPATLGFASLRRRVVA
ncbi:hypothetical protein [Lacipirellula parvula]|uniref:Uncharacterized protein n=1 Tax=Lacipirellula parvula TaxID=2650471 RepID=A0A5K7XHU8_9BACT|nr:hypothetical protein [Lacipirellula parvula]BBO32519.1 hypothetical protein PLANPX_2131 [Lacipirellula parvula]